MPQLARKKNGGPVTLPHSRSPLYVLANFLGCEMGGFSEGETALRPSNDRDFRLAGVGESWGRPPGRLLPDLELVELAPVLLKRKRAQFLPGQPVGLGPFDHLRIPRGDP